MREKRPNYTAISETFERYMGTIKEVPLYTNEEGEKKKTCPGDREFRWQRPSFQRLTLPGMCIVSLNCFHHGVVLGWCWRMVNRSALAAHARPGHADVLGGREWSLDEANTPHDAFVRSLWGLLEVMVISTWGRIDWLEPPHLKPFRRWSLLSPPCQAGGVFM